MVITGIRFLGRTFEIIKKNRLFSLIEDSCKSSFEEELEFVFVLLAELG